MSKMLDNCHYNKLKLLYKLSCALWFIEKHAKNDAQKTHDVECEKVLEDLSNSLDKYIGQLNDMICHCKKS